MAIIKKADIKKMNFDEIKIKLEELKLELVKSQVISKKTTAKINEIKKTIARLKTFSKQLKTKRKMEVKNGD